MGGWFRIHSANWLTGGLHVVILAVAAHAKSLVVWQYSLAAMALLSFAAWIGNYRRLRQIEDTPTSNIATAAQGYVEITGRAQEPGGTPIVSRLTSLPCVWYRYEVYQKTSDNKWRLEDYGASEDPFVVKDATGQCVVDPEGAEVICARKETWVRDDRRYVEWLLLPQALVYALGEFATIGGAASVLDTDVDVGALLAEWKKNQPELLRRFDLNQDGSLDLKEWELARHQAKREVEAQHRDIRMSPGTNVLRKPADGRLFLISDYLPQKLERTFLLWGWAHLAIFLTAAGIAVVLL